jgi:hypothetical protein
LNYVEVCYLSEKGISLFVNQIGFEDLTGLIWSKVVSRLKGIVKPSVRSHRFWQPLPSQILETYPSILSEFAECRWKLLYRGSDDGFGASNFHKKCDGIANTVTIILSTTGCIFGGFTPVAWDSTSGYKPDPTNQSFVFRIKNRLQSEPCKFQLSNPSCAIHCTSSNGPTFGNGHDIKVADSCNQNNSSYTNLGNGYANDTGIDGKQVFTGEQYFKVKEIEVFTITE